MTAHAVRDLHTQSLPTFNMLELDKVDLRADPAVASYVKNEVVDVVFARVDGQLSSREGTNHFQVNDALITGSTGDQWSVSHGRFHAKYVPTRGVMAGSAGKYQSKPIPVLARQMSAPFTIARTKFGDQLRGLAHDWLLQYAPGDFGVVENARFQRVYRRCEEPGLRDNSLRLT